MAVSQRRTAQPKMGSANQWQHGRGNGIWRRRRNLAKWRQQRRRGESVSAWRHERGIEKLASRSAHPQWRQTGSNASMKRGKLSA